MKKKKPDYLKETPKERKERINKSGNSYITKTVPSKKLYKRTKKHKGDNPTT